MGNWLCDREVEEIQERPTIYQDNPEDGAEGIRTESDIELDISSGDRESRSAQESELEQEEPTVTLYHYTTKDGAKAILDSGKVRQSNSQGDAAFGNGVYMTSLSPRQHGMKQVAENNYDGGWSQNSGKTHAAIEFKFPKNHVEKMSSDRNVWLYTDGDLDVARYATNQVFVGNTDGSYRVWYLSP